MRILFLSQVFWPDTASTAQHLYDLAVELSSNGHEVKVICSRYNYEDTSIKYPKHEIYSGIKIERLNNTPYGKSTNFGRLLDFLSFNLILLIRLLRISKGDYDIILGMTSPPMVSYIGLLISRLKKVKFCYWAMDLQPELAIASGLIKKKSLSAFLLKRMADIIIKRANLIIALDKYMKKYLVDRGANENRIDVIPVWPVVNNTYIGRRLDNPYRIEHNFQDKIVIMYSGNHAFVHPLDTILEAAKILKDDGRFLFVFVGGGVRKKEVTKFKEENNLNNIRQLSYEPRNNIHNSLGSADIHLVILGDGLVGYTHPNKIYGAMFIGKPIAYIGPVYSHVTDILKELEGNIQVNHGDSFKLVKELNNFASLSNDEKKLIGEKNIKYAKNNFLPGDLKRKMRLALTAI
jgi:Glycosyltransferase